MKFTPSNVSSDIREAERKKILSTYRVLYKLASPVMKGDDTERIRKAFRFTVEAYEGMRRPSGEPYVYHPIEVASITAEKLGLGTSSIICALLHNVIVDTKISGETIKREFGTEIAEIVVGLTRLTEASSLGLAKQAAGFKSVLSSFSFSNISIILIKIAECVHNMGMLDDLPESKRLQIIHEAKHIYAPLAHMLGLHHMQLELEDLHLRFTNRMVYNAIANRIKATKSTKKGFLNRFVAPIHAALKREGFHFTIQGRTKSVASIWHKMSKRFIPFEEIHDLYAVRIVFESESAQEHNNCWLIYEIVRKLYEPKPDRLRDWLKYPKPSGYEALHTTVMSPEGQWVEVQIRTTRMDSNAEQGNAAHWKYKNKGIAKQIAGMDKWLEEARKFLIREGREGAKVLDIATSSLYVDNKNGPVEN